MRGGTGPGLFSGGSGGAVAREGDHDRGGPGQRALREAAQADPAHSAAIMEDHVAWGEEQAGASSDAVGRRGGETDYMRLCICK